MSRRVRNIGVEQAKDKIVGIVDEFISGETISVIPDAEIRNRLQNFFETQRGSVKLAGAFLLAYSLVDNEWNRDTIPTGIRGKYGDKALSSELTRRYVTFHDKITAFGENLGWKGNVESRTLSGDKRFEGFLPILGLNDDMRKVVLNYICSLIAESRVIPAALPPLPDNYLTYARSVSIFTSLINTPSEGHIQQFLVAAILYKHRQRYGIKVQTHHPHAADKFDDTCGDIEEFLDGTLINAYEVTVRPDWKNRLPDLREKMQKAGLKKYVLIASGISTDGVLSDPRKLIEFTEDAGFDLAIVDIFEFVRVFCSELKAQEVKEVISKCYEYLLDEKLCGRHEIISSYKGVVDQWIDG